MLESCDEGGYTVYVPALPGCISEGETRDEALANIRESIKLYLEPVEDDYISTLSVLASRYACNITAAAAESVRPLS